MANSQNGLGITAVNNGVILHNCAKAIKRVFEPAAYWSAVLGGIATVAIMLMIVVEVFLRIFFNQSITGIMELISIILPCIIFSGMAYANFKKAHVIVNVIVAKLSHSAQTVIANGVQLFAFLIVLIAAWKLFDQGMFMKLKNVDSGYLAIPTWPSITVCSGFMLIFALSLLADFMEGLAGLISGARRLIPPSFLAMGLVLLLFSFMFNPDLLPFEFSGTQLGVLFSFLLFTLIFLGIPIGAAMAMVSSWGMAVSMESAEMGLLVLGIVGKEISTSFLWVVVPLFMMLGTIVGLAGFGTELYNTAYRWIGNIKGGLASATLGACAVFSAVVGDSMSGLLTMGKISLPEMKRLKYDLKMALGSIGVGASLGILIPPSIGFIIYGLLVEQSIGKLFIAGIIPGIIATILMMLMVTYRCWRNPAMGPASGVKYSLLEKLKSFKASWSVFLLLLIILGGIWVGFFTPIEAGAIGSFFALLIALFRRRLTSVSVLNKALVETVQLTSVVFFIFIYATVFTRFLTVTELPVTLVEMVGSLELNRYLILIIILLAYLLLGCVMNAIPVLIITLPIVYPTVMGLEFDPIWFGVLIIIMVEIAQLTPPIGMSVFALRAIAGKEVSLATIFLGVVPFWMMLVLTVAIIIVFPQTALFLVALMEGG